MASHQPLSKSNSSPAVVSSLVPQSARPFPEITEESRETEQPDLRAQLQRADRLGHNFKYISPVAGVPPLQTRPDFTAEHQTETEIEEAPPQRKENAAAGDPPSSGAAGSTPPGVPNEDLEFGSSTQLSLQAQFERAGRLGHQFNRMSVLSDRATPVQTHPLNGWLQRACAAYQQERTQQDLAIQRQEGGAQLETPQGSSLYDFLDPGNPEFDAHDPSLISDAEIQATNEYQSLQQQFYPDQSPGPEATQELVLACRLALAHMHRNQLSLVPSELANFVPQAQAQLATGNSAEIPSTPEIPTEGEDVNEIGIVNQEGPSHLKLRAEPSAPGGAILSELLFNTRVQIIKALPGDWLFVSTDDGRMGYAASSYIWSARNGHPLPEPNARLHRVEEGEAGFAQTIAQHYFGQYADNWGQDERFYVNVLAHLNTPDRTGDGSWGQVGFNAERMIWIPSYQFARSLVGTVDSGSQSYELADDLGLAETLDGAEQKWIDFRTAIELSQGHLGEAIGRHVTETLIDALISLAIMVVAAAAFLAISTAIGAAIGALAGGVGAAPGAAAGFKVGLLLLEWLGIAMIIQDVIDIANLIAGVADAFGQFIDLVWNANGDEAQLNDAALQFAEAMGMFVAAILEAILMLALEQGLTRAVDSLASTRLGESLGDNLTGWLRDQDVPETPTDRGGADTPGGDGTPSDRNTTAQDGTANLDFTEAAATVRTGDTTHTLMPQRWGGRTQLVMCSACGPITAKIDTLLEMVDDAAVRGQLNDLKTRIETLERQIEAGEVSSPEIIRETAQVADEINAIADSNPTLRDGLNEIEGAHSPEALAQITQHHADEWGVDPATERFRGTVEGLTPQQVNQLAQQPAVEGEAEIVRRWRRYLSQENADLSFEEWAVSGYRVNRNRDLSSPHEFGALAAVGATTNNSAGQGDTYTFTEAVDSNRRAVPQEDPNAVDTRTMTTRPDGTRLNPEGGTDIVEHKHLTGGDYTLNDSTQFRAQREMAAQGDGSHEVLISSDQDLNGGAPPVSVSGPLGNSGSVIYYYDYPSGRITHQWNAANQRWEPISGGR